MQPSIGYCGGESRPISMPRPMRPTSKPYFAVMLGDALVARLTREAPQALELALFLRAPGPAGEGYVEMDAPGYDRQVFGAALPSFGSKREGFHVRFGPTSHGWRLPTHLGVFGDDGSLLYYGALIPTGRPGEVTHWAPSVTKIVRRAHC